MHILMNPDIFPDILTSYYNMLILLTTANFPDVMLPAYLHNRAAFFFWMIFLTLGLFLFMNMLLAIFYGSY